MEKIYTNFHELASAISDASELLSELLVHNQEEADTVKQIAEKLRTATDTAKDIYDNFYEEYKRELEKLRRLSEEYEKKYEEAQKILVETRRKAEYSSTSANKIIENLNNLNAEISKQTQTIKSIYEITTKDINELSVSIKKYERGLKNIYDLVKESNHKANELEKTFQKFDNYISLILYITLVSFLAILFLILERYI